MARGGQAAGELPLGNARRWAVTVMLVSVLQILDTSVTNASACSSNGLATLLMSNASLSSDLSALAWPRLIQGIGMGCIFVPLQMLALVSVPISQLPNATALFSVVRNVGGSAGVAISTTLLSRRAPDAPVGAGHARRRRFRDRRPPAPKPST